VGKTLAVYWENTTSEKPYDSGADLVTAPCSSISGVGHCARAGPLHCILCESVGCSAHFPSLPEVQYIVVLVLLFQNYSVVKTIANHRVPVWAR
jgi:hypothetical protein